MTTLASDKPRGFHEGDFVDLPVIASDIIYQGAAVGDNASGYMRPLVSGDPFRGFADFGVDNASGSAGDKTVRLRHKGLITCTISGVAITDVGRPVYATDDDTFVLAGAGSYIGRVWAYVASNTAIVAFDTSRPERDIVMPIALQLAGITGNGDVVTTFTPRFWGRIKSLDFFVTTVVSTAAKAATLNLEIGTTNVTGGAVALTSANCTPLGAKVAGSAVTAANVFGPTDTISLEAASVTAFAEGAGTLLVRLGA